MHSEDDIASLAAQLGIRQRLDDHLRPDPERIAHGDADQWLDRAARRVRRAHDPNPLSSNLSQVRPPILGTGLSGHGFQPADDHARQYVGLDIHPIARPAIAEHGVFQRGRYQRDGEPLGLDIHDRQAGAVDRHRSLANQIRE